MSHFFVTCAKGLERLLVRELEALVRKIEHVELEREADFFQIFVEGAQFKPFAME